MIIVRIYSQLLAYPVQYILYTHLAVNELTEFLVRVVTAEVDPFERAVFSLTEGLVLAVTADVAISVFLFHTQAC